MPGRPRRKIKELRALHTTAKDVANTLYGLQPDYCRWEVADEIAESDVIGQAWINSVQDAVHAVHGIERVIAALECKVPAQNTVESGATPGLPQQ